MDNKADLRKEARFKTGDGSVVALKNKKSLKLGIMTDISKNGLAFCYLTRDPEYMGESKESFEANIFFEAERFSLFRIPCTIVKDNLLPIAPSSLGFGLMKKCRVQFGKLTSNQTSKLTYFIDNFTEYSIHKMQNNRWSAMKH